MISKIKLCECGCGLLVKEGNRFINGHNRKGIPNTEGQKIRISNTLKRIGHKPPPMYGEDNPSKWPEVRLKISRAKKGKKFSDEHKKALSVNHFKFHSSETKEKMSQTALLKVANGTHQSWKGGITPENLKIRHSLEIKEWRESVFERDNYTCQKCSVRGKVLHAHHNNKSFVIILNEFINHYSQFSRFKDKEILMKLAVGYKPFWDTNNGNTLCENCHERTGRPQAVIDAYKAAQAALAVPK